MQSDLCPILEDQLRVTYRGVFLRKGKKIGCQGWGHDLIVLCFSVLVVKRKSRKTRIE